MPPGGSKIRPIKLIFTGDITGLARAVTHVNAQLDRITKPMRMLSASLRKFDELSGLRRIRTSLGAVAENVGHLARRALFAGTVLGGAAFVGMKRFISGLGSLDDAARAAGTSVEFLQRGRFAAKRGAGVPTEVFDQSLRKFTVTLGQVRMRSGALNQVLSKTAPVLLRQLRAAKSTEAGFTIFIRALQRVDNAVARNTLLHAAFGRGGPLFGPMVNEWDQLVQLADELGIVLSRDVVDSGAQAEDELENLSLRVKGLGFLIGAELLPTLRDITKRVSDWTEQNRDLIRTEVPKFARQLAEGIAAVANFTAVALPKVTAFIEAIGGLKTVLVGVAAVIGLQLVHSLGLLSLALATTPVGQFILLLSGIATITLLIIKYWDELSRKTSWIGRIAEAGASLIPGVGTALGVARSGQSLLDGGAAMQAQRVDVGGNIQIEILGQAARVRGVASYGGIDISTLARGMSMVPGF